MAKKGQAVQLQQELNTDEDWDKMLQRRGLLVIDIYSEWSGPCTSMAANLKKVKMELGGDNLQLGVAKSDTISYLERFRTKSEPTWMFIVDGKMVNLMYGANSPKLMRLIAEELKKEAAVKEGTREREAREISELSDEEQVRYEIAKKIEDEKIRIETEKKARILKEWRVAVANVVLENITNCGVILVFPTAIEQVQAVLIDLWEPAGLAISHTEKLTFTEEMIEELLYFTETNFSDADIENLLNEQSLAYLVKPIEQDEYTGDIDRAVLKFVYGNSKCPPGSPESPAQLLIAHIPVIKEEPPESPTAGRSGEPSLVKLPSIPSLSALQMPSSATKQSRVTLDSKTEMRSRTEMSKTDVGSKEELRSKTDMQSKTKMLSKTGLRSKTIVSKTSFKEEPLEEEEEETIDVTGLWAPPNEYTKATAIKLFFPKLYEPIALPEPVPIPPHIAIAFDALNRREILSLMEEYANDVMRYGFFTTDNPTTAKLIAKTLPKYEKQKVLQDITGEKLVIQLSKKRSEPWCVFSQQSPTFMSHTPADGEVQCKQFFPEGFDEIEEEEEIEEVEKPTKKGKKGKEAEGKPKEELTEKREEEEGEEEFMGDEEMEEGQGEEEGEGEGEMEEDPDALLAALGIPSGAEESAPSPLPEEQPPPPPAEEPTPE